MTEACDNKVKRDDVDVAIGMTEGRRTKDEKGNSEEGDTLVYLTHPLNETPNEDPTCETHVTPDAVAS